MGQVVYLCLCLLGCLLLSPSVEGAAKNRTVVAQRAKCEGYLSYKGRCYAFFSHSVSWEAAEIECQAWKPSAHLASIRTQAEDRILSTYVKQRSNTNNIWIGFHATRSFSRLFWEWINGTPYLGSLWDLRSPSTSLSSSQCISLNQVQNPSGSPRWVQASCSNSYPFVCEFES